MASKSTVSRRGFMVAVGAAAAATTVPASVEAAPVTWQGRESVLSALRAAYRAEVERIASDLRPRFESGELHGWHFYDDDDGKDLDAGQADDYRDHPVHVLAKEIGAAHVPDFATAYLVLACSQAEDQSIPGDTELEAARYAAADCITVDVYRHARAHGWWRPRRGEYIGQDEWDALRDEVSP